MKKKANERKRNIIAKETKKNPPNNPPLLFQAAGLLIKEKPELELDRCSRLGPPYFTAKAKVTATAWGHTDQGDGSTVGNEQEAEGWRRGIVMGGVLKKRGGVFCPRAHKKVIASQLNPLSTVQPLMTSDPPFLSQC